MEETISRMAGSEHGSLKTVAELEEIAAGVGRPMRQRTTTYGEVDAERVELGRRATADLRAGGVAAPAVLPIPSLRPNVA